MTGCPKRHPNLTLWRFPALLIIGVSLLPLIYMGGAHGAIIADHRAAEEFDQIPAEWLAQARELAAHYGHTSHGEQIIQGLAYLETNMDAALYAYESDRTGLPLPQTPPAFRIFNEYGIGPDTYWEGAAAVQRTLTTVAQEDYDFSMFGWCSQLEWYSEPMIADYTSVLNQFEADVPGVQFIYMTGHLASSSADYIYTENDQRNIHLRNEQIRAYVRQNNKVLFDFADIEAYRDGSDTPCTTNRYHTTDYGYPVECDYWDSGDQYACAHTYGPNCTRKAKAFWWMMARLAGWQGGRGMADDSSSEVVHMLPSRNIIHPAVGTEAEFVFSPESPVRVKIRIYNRESLIREIAQDLSPGTHTLLWDGKNDRGEAVSSGTYLAVIEAGKTTIKRKVAVLR